MSCVRHFFPFAILLPLPARAGLQSALHPQSVHAARITEITWVMFISGAIIFAFVIVVLILALYGPTAIRQRLGGRWLIIGAGVVFPIVTLSALLAYSLGVVAFTTQAPTPPAARIEVVGEMWWWRLRYLDRDGQLLFETANDIRIPAGVPVEFVLKSDNVIHSFWVPNLAGKLDMVPGHVNRLRVQTSAPGVYRGVCAEYCGAQHAKMMFDVKAVSMDNFKAWMAAQRLPAKQPTDETLQIGQNVFMQACTQCHTIRGTPANGKQGPDLTHVGSRSSLAAGILPNNVGALAGWISNSQHIKPQNKMPSFDQFTGRQLRAVAQYLASLK